MLNGIKVHLTNVVSPHQHGFCTGRRSQESWAPDDRVSPTFLSYAANALDQIRLRYNSRLTPSTSIRTKAFDKVVRRPLIQKLSLAGSGGEVLKWFHSTFQINRPARQGTRRIAKPLEYLRDLHLDQSSSLYTSTIVLKLFLVGDEAWFSLMTQTSSEKLRS